MGMRFVGINGNRDCYHPEQMESCTVGEFINYLQYFDEDMPLYLVNDNGYTYGSLSESDIEEHYVTNDGELDPEDSDEDLEESHKAKLNKLYIKDCNNLKEDSSGVDVMDLVANVSSKDLDHHGTDLYLRKTKQTTAIINNLPDIYRKNVTTFRDQIDHDIWYEIPFVYHK